MEERASRHFAGYTRQAYHKRQRREERDAFTSEILIQEVIKIRVVQKRIGTRKLYHMTSAFCCEHGIKMGRDRFNELMRDNSMLIRRRRARKPQTTISCRWKRYPDLIKDYVPTGANQVWVSDITYVRAGEGHGFLSLITDAYSRKIVGYKLFPTLGAEGSVAALKMALRNNPGIEDLIHHSDRGTQYSSAAYLAALGTSRAKVSMTQDGNPLDNAIAERVNGILKQELLEKHFTSFREARSSIDEAVNIYNHFRPHMSIDMLTPAEAHTRTGTLKRRWKNYFSTRPIAQAMA